MNKNIWISYLVQRLAWHEGCHAADLVTEQGQGHMNIIIINMALNKKWGLNGDIGGHLKFKLITKKYIFKKKPTLFNMTSILQTRGQLF